MQQQPAQPLAWGRGRHQKLNGDVDKLLRAKTVPGSDEEQRVKNDIKQRASELLTTASCASALSASTGARCPRSSAPSLSPRCAISSNATTSAAAHQPDYEVKYGDEELSKGETGGEAKVVTTLKQTKGKSTTATIEYRLIQHEKQWMVYDVITDELSLVRNYRSTFLRIIGNSGYDGLLNKMKTKLTEERARDAKDEQERAAKKTAAAGAPAPSPKNQQHEQNQ